MLKYLLCLRVGANLMILLSDILHGANSSVTMKALGGTNSELGSDLCQWSFRPPCIVIVAMVRILVDVDGHCTILFSRSVACSIEPQASGLGKYAALR
ncbi:uncharacterized protein C8Q71DRAFT_500135 [Rhodofomes roseus]|uniref:Secreted protein n=1 Tax=Rhodofomes roseus TaxID=34475 RepID=A0ABQ8KM44_9APHY|nr:uncharacterized protein C8Q71DRAFT_500135 [Rhodofomes roseus]KAH9839168.1 hypothetical protein C8Q71DRAFT_500135 [Rhodofomes roseus]